MAAAELDARIARMRELRDYLERQVNSLVSNAAVNGDQDRRVPNISNMSFGGVDGESLLIALDLKGIAVSTGSACASGSLDPSHVLQAMGLAREDVRGSLRFSLSAYTTREEIDYAVSILVETVTRLRAMAPSDEVETVQSI